MLKGLVGSKSLTRNDMESVLDKMREHLIGMTLLLHFLFCPLPLLSLSDEVQLQSYHLPLSFSFF